jgi:hypothetical protein
VKGLDMVAAQPLSLKHPGSQNISSPNRSGLVIWYLP